jgi:chromosomal replication initiation ATPase DnaA
MSEEPRQLILPFTPRTCYGNDDFLVAECNQNAIGWLDRWPNWSAPGLVIYGPTASGKSHLVQLFLGQTGGEHIAHSTLGSDIPDVNFEFPAMVLDDADEAIRSGHERPLLHLFNSVKESGGCLLLTGTTPPARWHFKIADLASRIRALPTVGIEPPDDTVLTALIVKLFHDRQVSIDERVPAFILSRVSRSFAAVRSIVNEIDAVSISQRRRVSIPLVRQVLTATTTQTSD